MAPHTTRSERIVTVGRAGVLVDCDGTLVDTNYLHALAWSRALAISATGRR